MHFVSELHISGSVQMDVQMVENPWAFHFILTGTTATSILQIRKLRRRAKASLGDCDGNEPKGKRLKRARTASASPLKNPLGTLPLLLGLSVQRVWHSEASGRRPPPPRPLPSGCPIPRSSCK